MKLNKISIIIPIYNESLVTLKNVIEHIGKNFTDGEIIIVDGKCNGEIKKFIDNINMKHITCIYTSQEKSTRSSAMNEGARGASGDILLFLHVDTLLPKKSYQILSQLNLETYDYGGFYKKFAPSDFLLDVNALLTNLRLQFFGSLLGDNAIFISKELFVKVGGFPELDLMEDIEISKNLKKYGNIKVITTPVITSSRKFKRLGTLRTLLLMGYLRILYFFGTSTKDIRKKYENT